MSLQCATGRARVWKPSRLQRLMCSDSVVVDLLCRKRYIGNTMWFTWGALFPSTARPQWGTSVMCVSVCLCMCVWVDKATFPYISHRNLSSLRTVSHSFSGFISCSGVKYRRIIFGYLYFTFTPIHTFMFCFQIKHNNIKYNIL